MIRCLSVSLYAALTCFVFSGTVSAADEFPTRPVEILAPYGTAANSAVALQLITEEASKSLSRPMLVVAATGGGGTVAGERVAKRSKPDGYTLLLVNAATNGASLYSKRVNYTNADFEFLAEYGTFVLGLVVGPDSPFDTIEEFLSYVRSNPNAIKQASTGAGTTGHLALELLKLKGGNLKIDMVPFKNSFEQRTAVLGGHTQSAFLYGGGGGDNDEFAKLLKSGGKLLAVTSPERLPAYPEVPTFREKGIDAVFSSWYGVAGPKGMPPEATATLKKALYGALENPQVQSGIESLGFKFEFRKAEEFTEFVNQYEAQVKSIVTEANLNTE